MCVHVFLRMNTRVCTHVHVFMCANTHMCMCIHVFTYMSTRVFMYVSTHVGTCAHGSQRSTLDVIPLLLFCVVFVFEGVL